MTPLDVLASATPKNHFLVWCEIEEMKPAIHESGHAVIARLLNFDVAWVSVDRKFISNDPLAIERDLASGSAVCITLSSPRLPPILQTRGALTKKDKATVIDYCSHVLAGPHSEMTSHVESFDPLYCMNDYEQVFGVLQSAEPNRVLRKKLLDAARRQVSRMVTKNWGLIVEVSLALDCRGTLLSRDIDAFIQSANACAT